MKKIQIIMVMVLCVACYWAGYHNNDTQNYEAACLEADCIRYLIDHYDGKTKCSNIGAELEESYYEFFDGLSLDLFKTKYITDVKDFDQYCWCY